MLLCTPLQKFYSYNNTLILPVTLLAGVYPKHEHLRLVINDIIASGHVSKCMFGHLTEEIWLFKLY